MKTSYQTKKLDEICNIDYGARVVKSRIVSGSFDVYGGGGKTFTLNEYNRENCTIVSRFAMSKNCVRTVSGKFFLNDSGLSVSTKDSTLLSQDFLDKFLFTSKDLIYSLGRGQAQRNLHIDAFRKIEIPLPPLATQRKIVAILDEKFAKLREAKRLREEAIADTEKILSTTLREIFEEGKEKGWEKKTFEEVLIFKTGKLDSNAMIPGGKYPFFTCAQKTYEIDSYSFNQKAVLLAGNNAAGKYSVKFYDGKFDAYQRTYVISVKDETQLDYTYLTNYISHILNDLRDLSVGANTKFLTMKVLNKITIPLPPLTEQKQIVTRLDTLSEKLRTLRELQQSQLDDMKKLEKAYLREAFRGELC
jgi:type I restriction enzyme, S subunit